MFQVVFAIYFFLSKSVFALLPQVSQNGEFTFSYDALSSYLSYGNYEIEGNRLIAVTEDQKYHYQFITTDYGALLFDAKNSSEILLTDSKQNVDNFMIDGSIFVKTDALRLLREADVLTQNISNNLRQDTTITNQEFQKNIPRPRTRPAKRYTFFLIIKCLT